MVDNKQNIIFEEIINLIPYQIYWKDKDLNYLGANNAFAKAAGFKDAQDIIGKSDLDSSWPKEDSKSYKKNDLKVIETKSSMHNIEESQTQADGTTKIFLTSKIPLFNFDNKIIGLLGFNTDITELKNIEKEKENALLELEKLQTTLLQNEKLRSLGLMASGIAHEINNPLAVMAGKANIIKKLISKSCDDLIRTVYRCTDVIQNLKDFSRQKPEDEIKQFLLSTSLKTIIDLVSLKTECKGKLEIVNNSQEMTVSAKRISFEQSLINIIENAIYEQKDNKEIKIVIENYNTDKPGIIVLNPGEPIAKDMLNSIFDPFFTTKPVGEGTGLGLSTCKSLMKSCGGDISYKRHNNMNGFIISFLI